MTTYRAGTEKKPVTVEGLLDELRAVLRQEDAARSEMGRLREPTIRVMRALEAMLPVPVPKDVDLQAGLNLIVLSGALNERSNTLLRQASTTLGALDHRLNELELLLKSITAERDTACAKAKDMEAQRDTAQNKVSRFRDDSERLLQELDRARAAAQLAFERRNEPNMIGEEHGATKAVSDLVLWIERVEAERDKAQREWADAQSQLAKLQQGWDEWSARARERDSQHYRDYRECLAKMKFAACGAPLFDSEGLADVVTAVERIREACDKAQSESKRLEDSVLAHQMIHRDVLRDALKKVMKAAGLGFSEDDSPDDVANCIDRLRDERLTARENFAKETTLRQELQRNLAGKDSLLDRVCRASAFELMAQPDESLDMYVRRLARERDAALRKVSQMDLEE